MRIKKIYTFLKTKKQNFINYFWKFVDEKINSSYKIFSNEEMKQSVIVSITNTRIKADLNSILENKKIQNQAKKMNNKI